MNVFCNLCTNIVHHDFESGNLIFRCMCGNVTQALPEQTLLYSENMAEVNMGDVHQQYINNAVNDPTVERVDKECKKCGFSPLKIISIGSEEKTYYICEICDRK